MGARLYAPPPGAPPAAPAPTMKKIAYTIDLVDDPVLADEYCALHQDVWPEVRHGLRSVGVVALDIFRHDRRLFLLMEVTDDFDADVGLPAYLDTHPRCREWEALMDRFHAPLPGARPGEKWCAMEQVCRLR